MSKHIYLRHPISFPKQVIFSIPNDFLDLSTNKLSGELSAPFVSGWLSLMFLHLSCNNFYGQIFCQFYELDEFAMVVFGQQYF